MVFEHVFGSTDLLHVFCISAFVRVMLLCMAVEGFLEADQLRRADAALIGLRQVQVRSSSVLSS